MAISPEVIVDGVDVSAYFKSCHAEMTANHIKDPGKYDIVLANVGGIFYGAFLPTVQRQVLGGESIELYPRRRVFVKVNNVRKSCDSIDREEITIFSGEIQKAECDELECRIEGSCTQGGWSSALVGDRVWKQMGDIETIVNNLLDDFGYTGERHIAPLNPVAPDLNPEALKNLDFDTAMNMVAAWAQSIYFFDEDDEFWFIPAADVRMGWSNLDGVILRGPAGRSAVGYCNVVTVYGGTDQATPQTSGAERKLHKRIMARVEAEESLIDAYGRIEAPAIYVPNCNQEQCQLIAENLLAWYDQYRDVPSVKIVGEAPSIMSKVEYHPWNQSPTETNCDPGEDNVLITGKVKGVVTRRIVDISADGGFVCTIEVTQNLQDAGAIKGRGGFPQDDPKINPYPGVTFVADDTVEIRELMYQDALANATESDEYAANPAAGQFVYNPSTEESAMVSPMEARLDYIGNGWYYAQESSEW